MVAAAKTEYHYRLEQGLVQVYTGNGKGKTTAALGLALRAVGQDLRVCILQFMKGQQQTGELKSSGMLGENLQILQFGSGRFNRGRAPTEEELALAAEGLEMIRKVFAAGNVDLLILDEISHAVNQGLIPLAPLADLIRSRPPHVEVVLTGRYMPKQLLDLADLISEIKAVRHPFEVGCRARKGIEF